MSEFEGKAEDICSHRVLLIMTQAGPLPISGRSWSSDQLGIAFVGQAVGKELSHARPVMLGKYLGHQFAPTTDPDLVKDRLHIP
jgi:hypothetical protein